ncbi:unnamed protein product [Acanthoscelides obtectus]|uniref:THAP-type domain-containing protein n=1 Tax=Acanthoscelides obtectus TaxID=200917 RepID=A0A9P0P5Q9_ACAOB|nr:unnamed protein product [Acanthoscelides obtectus]CAK1680153.1 hypothetical protein AOBTE_LOCUS32523 [Acanthoscelides obtectus]
MKSCVVCGATNSSEQLLSFHRFPKDRRLMNVWIAILDLTKEQVKDLTAETLICSKHFKNSDFFETPCGQICLKPGTVPIFVMEPDQEHEVRIEQQVVQKKHNLQKEQKIVEKEEKAIEKRQQVVQKAKKVKNEKNAMFGRTFDDLKLEDFRENYEKAKECWKIVNDIVYKNQKYLTNLNARNRSLRKRLEKLKNMGNKLHKKENND